MQYCTCPCIIAYANLGGDRLRHLGVARVNFCRPTVCVCAYLVLQVSRIFAVNLLHKAATLGGSRWDCDVMDNVYVVTSDADLWPISSTAFDLPFGADILSLNAFCCGNFKHRSKTYRMIPMSCVGARVSTWQKLTNR